MQPPTSRRVIYPLALAGAALAIAAIIVLQRGAAIPTAGPPAPKAFGEPGPRAPMRFDVPPGWELAMGQVREPVLRIDRLAPGFTVLRRPGKPQTMLQILASENPSAGDNPVRPLREAAQSPGGELIHDRQTPVASLSAQDIAYLRQTPDGAQVVRFVYLRSSDRAYSWTLQVGEMGSRRSDVMTRFQQATADLDRMLASTRLE